MASELNVDISHHIGRPLTTSEVDGLMIRYGEVKAKVDSFGVDKMSNMQNLLDKYAAEREEHQATILHLQTENERLRKELQAAKEANPFPAKTKEDGFSPLAKMFNHIQVMEDMDKMRFKYLRNMAARSFRDGPICLPVVFNGVMVLQWMIDYRGKLLARTSLHQPRVGDVVVRRQGNDYQVGKIIGITPSSGSLASVVRVQIIPDAAHTFEGTYPVEYVDSPVYTPNQNIEKHLDKMVNRLADEYLNRPSETSDILGEVTLTAKTIPIPCGFKEIGEVKELINKRLAAASIGFLPVHDSVFTVIDEVIPESLPDMNINNYAEQKPENLKDEPTPTPEQHQSKEKIEEARDWFQSIMGVAPDKK